MNYHDYIRYVAFDVHFTLRTPDEDPDDPEIIIPTIQARLSKSRSMLNTAYSHSDAELTEAIMIIVYNLVGE